MNQMDINDKFCIYQLNRISLVRLADFWIYYVEQKNVFEFIEIFGSINASNFVLLSFAFVQYLSNDSYRDDHRFYIIAKEVDTKFFSGSFFMLLIY